MHFYEGDVVYWPSFTSVTTNRNVALKFGDKKYLFEVIGIDEEVRTFEKCKYIYLIDIESISINFLEFKGILACTTCTIFLACL